MTRLQTTCYLALTGLAAGYALTSPSPSPVPPSTPPPVSNDAPQDATRETAAELARLAERLEAMEKRLTEINKQASRPVEPPPEPDTRVPHVQVRENTEAPAWHTDYAEALNAASASGKRLLVLFTLREGCPLCETFKQRVLTQRKVGDFLSRFVLLRVDDPAKAAKWKVERFPLIRVWDVSESGGRHQVNYVAGWTPSGDVQEFLTKLGGL